MNIKKETKVKIAPEIKELEDLVGNFMQYWGFKKIHGRIWTHLYTSTEALDSQSLMSRLKVSKGLMSIAIRDLLEYEVIMPVSTGKHGVTFYQANPDLMGVITNVLRKREAVMLSSVLACTERIASINQYEVARANIDIKKIENIKNMTQSAQGLLTMFILNSCQRAASENISIFSDLKFESNA